MKTGYENLIDFFTGNSFGSQGNSNCSGSGAGWSWGEGAFYFKAFKTGEAGSGSGAGAAEGFSSCEGYSPRGENETTTKY